MTLSLPANRVPTLDFSRSEGPQQHCQGFMPLGIMKLSLIIIIIIIHSTEKYVLVSIVIISARLQKHKLDIHLMMKETHIFKCLRVAPAAFWFKLSLLIIDVGQV